MRDELNKLILSAHPRKGLTLLVDTGLAERVFPSYRRCGSRATSITVTRTSTSTR